VLPLPKAEFQALLQEFVGQMYMKGFRHLGDERDFDHGHFLYNAESKAIAILYHTQELADQNTAQSGYGYIDPAGRNWIQWLGQNRIENADHYLRKTYPATATWDWFREFELPGLTKHHTILDKMLDPSLVALDVSKTSQWVFSKIPCAQDSPSSDELQIVLPTNEMVCLSLSGD
jgi:hypothetical protein